MIGAKNKMKKILLPIILLITLSGCGQKQGTEETKNSSSRVGVSSTKESSSQQLSTESTIQSSTSTTQSSEEKQLSLTEQATEIATKVAEDFKKNIIGTFEYTDTSSWGSTVSMTFKEDNTILMTETDTSFQKTNLTYEGTYEIKVNPIASNLLDIIDETEPENLSEVTRACLKIETYEEYVSFMDSYQSSIYENKYLPVDIKTTVKGYMSRDINEEKNTEAKLSYSNFKLEISSNTSIFKNAGQPSLIKK